MVRGVRRAVLTVASTASMTTAIDPVDGGVRLDGVRAAAARVRIRWNFDASALAMTSGET